MSVLHLRQNTLWPHEILGYDDDSHGCSSAERLTFLTHRWATAFFDYMHRRNWSPNLKTLIMGCYITDNLNLEDFVHTPQHCFVKGIQTDVLGRSGAVTVPVPRVMIMHNTLCAELLKYDPACDWVGDLPGGPDIHL
jgi:hypothetical protein